MKYLATFLIFCVTGFFNPAYATYGLTKSAHLASASSQSFSGANTATTGFTGNFSGEMWVRFTSLPTSGNRVMLMSKWDNATTWAQASYYWDLNNNAGTYELRLVISNGTDNASVSVVNWTPSTGTWYHIAFNYNTSGTVQFAVNGSQQGSDQTGALTTRGDGSTTATYLGAYLNSGSPTLFLDGDISLARLWAETRTIANFNTNQCSVLGATTNLKAEWTLNDTLNDNSGNSNTLTNNNTATFTTALPSTCATVAPASSIESDLILFE